MSNIKFKKKQMLKASMSAHQTKLNPMRAFLKCPETMQPPVGPTPNKKPRQYRGFFISMLLFF